MGERDDGELLDLVYGAAVDPALWAPVMERFADMVGGESGWLSQLSAEDGSGGDAGDPMVRIDPVWVDRYLEHFATRNPLHAVERPREYLRQWSHRILTDEDWMPKNELTKSEFYNDFMRPQDYHSALMIRLAARGVEVATLNISRPQRRGQFTTGDREIAERLHPHFIRAFELGREIGPLRRLAGDLASVLDLSTHGLFLLDVTGRVRHLNLVAERLLADRDVLCLSGGRLSAVAPAAARQLHGLIAAAAAPESERRTGGAMALPAAARSRSLSATVAPLRAVQASASHRDHGVIVCVTDLAAGARLPQSLLRDLFDLTPAETRLALSLFDGASLRESADSFGVSQHTVHAQLARIFDKTGVNRQSQLMRLIMRLANVSLG